MHSFIYHSATKEKRHKNLFKQIGFLLRKNLEKTDSLTDLAEPDVLLIEPTRSISIDQIRTLKRNLAVKPYSRNCKIAVIISADLLTIPAQNSLLKTLEEPTANTFLFLELKNPNNLLPTILSRCQLIKVKDKPTAIDAQQLSETENLLKALLISSPGKRITLIRTLSDRNRAKVFLKEVLQISRKRLLDNSSWSSTAKLAQKNLLELEANVNPRLVLENFSLKLKRQ